jgi:uncharacterized protein (DUF305 family)
MTARRKTYVIIAGLAIALAAGGLAWASTSSDGGSRDRPAAGPTRSPVPVVVPGRPGESASVLPPDRVPTPAGNRHNDHDVRFVRMMIPHHRQALELAALAPGRARDPRIRAIAERISVAQGPEVDVFLAWLRERRLPPEEPAAGHPHDHGDMPGMASPAQVRALAGTTGAAFDRMFVDLMAAHHEGAVAMCRDVLRAGTDERLHELATGIAAEQQIEVRRMREALGR